VIAATTGTPDTEPPATPSDGLAVVPNSIGTTWLKLQWQPATDTYGVDHYVVSVDGAPVATVGGVATAYTVTGLQPGTTYALTVAAVDASGNATTYGQAASATTNPPYDKAVPTWSRNAELTVSKASATSVVLSWPAATDDQRIAGYRVYGRPVTEGRLFTPVNEANTTAATTYTVSGLAPGTRYTFTVQAGDTADKWTGSGPARTVRMS
jgi:exo-poly-alpha-galacturonosidase